MSHHLVLFGLMMCGFVLSVAGYAAGEHSLAAGGMVVCVASLTAITYLIPPTDTSTGGPNQRIGESAQC